MAIQYPIRQSTLAKKMELYMDTIAKKGSQRAGSFPQKTRHMLYGMEFLGLELGINCDCSHTGTVRPARIRCKCSPMTARQRMAGFGKTGGPHCRDEDGEFIPVPQCTRRLPADIKIATPPAPKRKRKRRKKRS